MAKKKAAPPAADENEEPTTTKTRKKKAGMFLKIGPIKGVKSLRVGLFVEQGHEYILGELGCLSREVREDLETLALAAIEGRIKELKASYRKELKKVAEAMLAEEIDPDE